MNEDPFAKTAQQAAAFQQIWMDSISRLMQTAVTFGPTSPPPEVLRQMRDSIFQALARSWEEFMRSPEFLESMKQWLENAVAFRKMTNDFLAAARQEAQAPSREDLDNLMLSLRHLERRLLDRMDALSAQFSKPGEPLTAAPNAAPTNKSKSRRPASSKPPRTNSSGVTNSKSA